MIPVISREVLDNVRRAVSGATFETVDRMFSELKDENPSLASAMFDQSCLVADSVDVDEDIKQTIQQNFLLSMCSVYRAIKVQLEVNELEELYS